MSPKAMNNNPFRTLPIGDVVESPLNPRKHFDQVKLQELASSIRRQGILTPLLVRPANGHHEIGAGHRRHRAALLAGLTEVPVIIREMDDDTFYECIAIENLQREDVHPLEEGEGYAELLKRPGYDAAAIAEKIGKTEAYVHGRLQLCDLVEPTRGAFLEGRITIGHARLISRLDPKQQEKALGACFGYQDTLVATADLKRWIRQSAGRDLAKAPFGLEDHTLGKNLACVHCPKAAGVNPLLIDEDGQKTCLDPACFDGKVKQFIAKRTNAGLLAISTQYSPAHVPAGALCAREYEEIFTEPDDQDEFTVKELKDEIEAAESEEAKAKLERELADLQAEMAKQQADCGYSEPAVTVDGWSDVGKETRICRNPKCPVHGDRLNLYGDPKANAAAQAKADREAEARKLKEKARVTAREHAVGQIADGLDLDSIAPARVFLDILTRQLLHKMYSADRARKLADWFDVDLPKKGGCSDFRKALWAAYQKLDSEQKNQFLLRTFLIDEIDAHEHSLKEFDLLAECAKACKVNLKDLETATLGELKTEQKAKADKKAGKDKPAAKKASPKKASKPKPKKQADHKRAAAGESDDDDE